MNRENSNICVQIIRSNNFQVSVEHSLKHIHSISPLVARKSRASQKPLRCTPRSTPPSKPRSCRKQSTCHRWSCLDLDLFRTVYISAPGRERKNETKKAEDLLRVKISVNPPFFCLIFSLEAGSRRGVIVPGRKRSGSALRGPAGPPSVACALFSAGSGFRWRC